MPDLERTRVLVVDDDPLAAPQVERALEGLEVEVDARLTGEEGLKYVRATPPDVIVLDHILPDTTGIEVLEQLRDALVTCPVLFATAQRTGSIAIEAMKLGAFDYLVKPLDLPRLRTQVERAAELRIALSASLVRPDYMRKAGAASDELVGECPAMQSVFKAIGKVAQYNVSVLITGEQGTGKETVARSIHAHSSAADGPFTRLHCPSFAGEQLEQRLFGPSASSSSAEDRGSLAQATGGVLLLEEVGVMPLPLQGRLLSVLRDSHAPNKSNASKTPPLGRIITTSSVELEQLVRDGRLRSDLYYMLSSFVIDLPPLRSRISDLPLLIAHLIPRIDAMLNDTGRPKLVITDEAMQEMCRHTWPGNIDELQCVLRRALVDSKSGVVVPDTLARILRRDPVLPKSESATSAVSVTDWGSFATLRIESGAENLYEDATQEADRKLLTEVMHYTGGNQAQAARILGITRTSLRKKLKHTQLTAQQFSDPMHNTDAAWP